MKRFAIAATVLLCGITARAQLTTVTASSVKIGGVPIASGTVTFTPVNQQRQPIPFVTGGGGLNAPKAFKCQIASGAITGTCQVPDAAQTVPANILYSVEITDSASQSAFVMIVPGITGATWPLDQYAPAANTTNVQPLQISYGTAAPTGSCVSPSLYVRNAQGGQLYICVGGGWVVVGGTANGALSYTTFTPASLSNTNVVGAGDSRMAGSAVPAGQGFLDYLATQPQFANRATFYNGAVGGATCSSMTSVYATNVQPHKPAGAITRAYLLIEVGINDIQASVAIGTIESCLTSYLTTAVADGFTPVLNTVYFYSSMSMANDRIRLQLNDWIRQQNYLVIDIDAFIPETNYPSPWYLGDQLHFNNLGNQLWAKATNFLWGIDKSGTSFLHANTNIIDTPDGNLQISSQVSVSGSLAVNASGVVSFGNDGLGLIHSNLASNSGGYGLGSDGNCYLLRNFSSFTGWQNGCGPITLDNVVTSRGLIAAGTAFTVTGCGTATNLKGGPNAGQFTGASTTCNPVITPGYTAPNGFSCHANDFTTNITFRQTATTTTTATMTSSGTAGATDAINFECIAY